MWGNQAQLFGLLHGSVGIVCLQRYLKAYCIAVYIAGHRLLHLLNDPY